MELRQINYFITLCQYQSYTKAAKALFIAQPTLSQQIVALESSINMQLIDRSSKVFHLTPTGELFLEKAKKFNSHYINFEEEIEKIRNEQVYTLKYATLNSVNAHDYAANHFAEFRTRHPEIVISHSITVFYNLISFIEEDLIDISMALTFSNQTYENLGIIHLHDHDDQLVVVVPKDSKYSAIENFDSPLMCELLEKTCYLYDGWRYYDIPMSILKTYNPSLNKISFYDNLVYFLSTPYLWDGYTIIPWRHMKYLQAEPLYHVIEFPDNACSLDNVFLYKKNNSNPALKDFINEISIDSSAKPILS